MNGLKIMETEIINFKNIEKKIIKMDGRSLIVLGGNGQGKSSFIQALLSPLDSNYLPVQPIMDGEDRASIKVKISGELFSEFKEYVLDLYFTPSNSTGRLVVTNHLGEIIKSPKSLMKSIIGNIGFDVFEFLRMTPKKQVETLKNLAGLDFFEIDAKRKDFYDKRTYLNTKIKEEETLLVKSGYTDAQIELYSEPIDTTELKSQMANISASIETWLGIKIGVDKRIENNKMLATTIEGYGQKIYDLEQEILRLKTQSETDLTTFSTTVSEIEKGTNWLTENPKPSANDIQAKLNAADAHNEHYNKINAFAMKSANLIKLKKDSEALSESINGIDLEKQNLIKNSNLPIDGLSFNEEQVFYNGLPMTESQTNKSKLIEIGMRIGMCLNPNLRVIIINDGSLMDAEQLKIVVGLAQENNFQLIIEKVSEEGGEFYVEFTEQYFENMK